MKIIPRNGLHLVAILTLLIKCFVKPIQASHQQQKSVSEKYYKLDLSCLQEPFRQARRELAENNQLSPQKQKLLNPDRIIKHANKILSRVEPISCHDGLALASSHSNKPNDLPHTSKNNAKKRNCSGGGTAYSGSYTICELRESFHDVQTTLESVQNTIDDINISTSDATCSGIETVQSIVEDISDRLPYLCDSTIRQADIGASGGTYTISNSGSYCVGENLQGPGSTTIVNITTGNVTLDLCGHTIDGGNNAATCIGINPASGSGHVYIKNGNVINTKHGVEITGGSGVDGWTIENIQAVGTTTLPTTIGIYVNNASNGIIKLVGTNGCDTGIQIGENNTASNIIITDCVTQNGTSPLSSGFYIYADDTSNITVKNCIAFNGASAGFIAREYGNISFKNCLSITNQKNGFYHHHAKGTPRIILEGCISFRDNYSGINLYSTIEPIDRAIIRNCLVVESETYSPVYVLSARLLSISDTIAISHINSGSCFYIGSFIENNTSQISFRNCTAIGSGNEDLCGFSATTSYLTSGPIIINIEQCLAQNVGTGFHLDRYFNDTSKDTCTIIRDCSALSVKRFGFELSGNQKTYGTLRNCLTTMHTDAVSGTDYAAFFLDNNGSSLSLESCTAIGIASPVDGFRAPSTTSQLIFRGNTASGFSGTGFNDLSPSKNAFFNNLARDNTTNFSGINFTPTGGSQGAYFVANADGSAGGIPAFQPALAATMGYWANVADPN